MNWEKQARLIIRTELVRQGLTNEGLSKLLNEIGISITPRSLTSKLSRGTFSFVFFLQCMHVLGVSSVQLTKPENIKKQKAGK